MLRRYQPGTLEGEVQGLKYAVATGVIVAIGVFILLIILIVLTAIGYNIVKHYAVAENNDCYDGNTCTVDVKLDNGGCVYIHKPPNKTCTSRCHRSTNDLTCQYFQLTKGVQTPICYSPTLDTCKGTCETDGDCEDLPTKGGSLAGECKENTCYYVRDQTTGGAEYNSSEIPDLDCTTGAEIFQSYCRDYLNPIEPVIQDHCVSFDVQCEDADLSGGGTVPIPTCYYYWWCSVQSYVPDISKKRNIMANMDNAGHHSRNKAAWPMGNGGTHNKENIKQKKRAMQGRRITVPPTEGGASNMPTRAINRGKIAINTL